MDSKATRTLSRRQALRLAATATAVAAAGSMLTTATAAPKPASRVGRARRQTEPITLRVLDWQSGGKDFWDKTDELFMAQNPGIKVEHEAVPYGQYFDKVGAYIAADGGPDLMQLEVGLGSVRRDQAQIGSDKRPFVITHVRRIRVAGGNLYFHPQSLASR